MPREPELSIFGAANRQANEQKTEPESHPKSPYKDRNTRENDRKDGKDLKDNRSRRRQGKSEKRDRDRHEERDGGRAHNRRRTASPVPDVEPGEVLEVPPLPAPKPVQVNKTEELLIRAERRIADLERDLEKQKALSAQTIKSLQEQIRSQPSKQPQNSRNGRREQTPIPELNSRFGAASAPDPEKESMRKELAAMKTLLDQRTTELEAVRPFLSTQDNVSTADIKAQIEYINSKICHAAMLLANSVEEGSMLGNTPVPRDSSSSLGPQQDADDTRGFLFKNLISCLHADLISWISGHRSHGLFPMVLECCFQSIITHQCVTAFKDWNRAGDLQELYHRIQSNELVSIAGRWRSLTRRTIDHAVNQHEWLTFHSLPIRTSLASLLIIAGISSMGLEDLVDMLGENFGTNLEEILQVVYKLRGVVSQAISQDFMAFTTPHGAPFDSEGMVDTFESPASHGAPSVGSVLCTTQIGLDSVRLGKSLAGGAVNERDVFLQPHVLLSTSLKDDTQS